jgi:hypothetical protein
MSPLERKHAPWIIGIAVVVIIIVIIVNLP